jgi:hypothetical protein
MIATISGGKWTSGMLFSIRAVTGFVRRFESVGHASSDSAVPLRSKCLGPAAPALTHPAVRLFGMGLFGFVPAERARQISVFISRRGTRGTP